MVSIDVRTRPDVSAARVDPGVFAADQAGRPPLPIGTVSMPSLTIDVEGVALTFEVGSGMLTVIPGAVGTGVAVAMDQTAFTDLVTDTASTFWLHMMGRAHLVRGCVDDFIAWEPLLRCLIDGRAAYRPGSIAFTGRDGSALDLHRSFTLDDDHADIGQFLGEAGYLHLRGVFSATEMASVADDLDSCVRNADPEDGQSWWAKTADGQWYPSRILQFNRKSATLHSLLAEPRFRSVETLTEDTYAPVDPSAANAAEGLLKRPDVVEGVSDVAWHKDCSPGGHSRRCSGLVVGISLTDSGDALGELSVVAGSHRANIAPLGVQGLDLPRIALRTRAGDLTVHCSCTLHMSRPPQRGERRVVYAGLGLVPRGEDAVTVRGEEAVLAERASYNDRVRHHQQTGDMPSRPVSE